MTTEFTPTRTAALQRLADFATNAGRDYAARRNFDLGPGHHDAVSRLSPYLRCRLLTEAEVLSQVLDEHELQACEKFVQEVFWRTYWKGWLELRPSVWDGYCRDVHRQWNSVQTQSGLRDRWEAACTGETDIECFNFWAQELVNTGYLHNHARMWFASIWIFTLELPWSLGADFFLRHLLDGDPASNTLSWRWVAGLQTHGKTYLARTSNISKFTEGRFHPKWQLSGEAIPLDGQEHPQPRPLPELSQARKGVRTGLILHEEDLSADHVIGDFEITSTAVLRPQTQVGPLQSSERVTQFRHAALENSVSRWQDRLGAISWITPGEIASWCDKEGLEQVVTPYAPTGPIATALDRVELGKTTLVKIMRDYDRQAWPHATKGFFPFKKNIPAFIRELSLDAKSPNLI